MKGLFGRDGMYGVLGMGYSGCVMRPGWIMKLEGALVSRNACLVEWSKSAVYVVEWNLRTYRWRQWTSVLQTPEQRHNPAVSSSSLRSHTNWERVGNGETSVMRSHYCTFLSQGQERVWISNVLRVGQSRLKGGQIWFCLRPISAIFSNTLPRFLEFWPPLI